MKEEKLEQLRKVFKTKIKNVIKDAKVLNTESENVNSYAESISNQLVYEVKIRINSKQAG